MSSAEESKKERKKRAKKDVPSVEELRERLSQLVASPSEDQELQKRVLDTDVTPSEVN